MPQQERLAPYFAGAALYGDDLTPKQIKAWYEDEQEGYAELGAKDAEHYRYVYHALNALYGFRHLPERSFSHALGFGSAYGDEFEHIAERIDELTIVEPSAAFVQEKVYGIPATFIKPSIDGTLPFPDHAFDLITCLGVLHHIPNVSHVVAELHRCLQPKGYVLVREPVISMGDWRRPRKGLTKRERGIPIHLFKQMIARAGFKIVRDHLCIVPVIPRLWEAFGKPAFNSRLATCMDAVLAKVLKWNLQYHATSKLKKLRPTNLFFVLTR